ncbi:SH3 domain-containing protein [Falsigemmobacter faecalis]|uniref:SH3b domain-containing protein n=1 Tax=Falsigemmobacter faecalis TaxID=2488730 RepID=A0A3P3DYU9_9RHOB|nr:SH3 domain-containing protein [Falsigemmobacter faecalis]RRH78602.1 hypothetical protein EG244_01215 [Falsigemmobacter faecalis]
MLRLVSLLTLLGGGFVAATGFLGDQPPPQVAAATGISRAPETTAEALPAELPPAVQRIADSPVELPGVSLSTGPVILENIAPSEAMVQLAAAETARPQRGSAAGSYVTSFRQVTARSANVRGGPSTQNQVLGRLAQGDEVTVVEDGGNGWFLIRVEGDGLEGWISGTLLSQ